MEYRLPPAVAMSTANSLLKAGFRYLADFRLLTEQIINQIMDPPVRAGDFFDVGLICMFDII